MVRLTTARYYTPSGRCIQKPYVDGEEEYRDDIYKRFKHGELYHADSIKFPDSLRYFTQHKRVVYGGGGIMPDYFIPLDTSFVSTYYTDILRKGLHNDFTIQYVDAKRRDLLKLYPDIKAFKSGFTSDRKLLDEFVTFAADKGVARNDKDLAISGEQLTTVLKALIARNLYNLNAQFEILGTNDDELLKAVEVIKNDALFQKLSQAK